jgi:hypothetical protein
MPLSLHIVLRLIRITHTLNPYHVVLQDIRPHFSLSVHEASCLLLAGLITLRVLTRGLHKVSILILVAQVKPLLTGLLSMFWRSFRPFLIWRLRALESSGFSNSKLHNSSPETDMTAPQLSNSPQYCIRMLANHEKHVNQ